jgi:hypothetical protein
MSDSIPSEIHVCSQSAPGHARQRLASGHRLAGPQTATGRCFRVEIGVGKCVDEHVFVIDTARAARSAALVDANREFDLDVVDKQFFWEQEVCALGRIESQSIVGAYEIDDRKSDRLGRFIQNPNDALPGKAREPDPAAQR